MDEARSLSYSINVEANTSGAEADIRNITSSLGNLQNGGGRINISADTSDADDGIRRVTGELGNLSSEAEHAEGATDDLGDAASNAKKDVSELGESAEESGGKFEKLGGVLKGVGVAIGAVSAAAAAGAVALGTQVVSTFADYEQLVGGIDTLFGQASKEVQGYAANAYKTAGMSANEYMELTTSFSSSLIKSLGGDTQKAAQYADRAITDMSDNANKMGTNIESLQNAYRGFSMGNYTMLDNLKLGYGGTQDEMKRLLADAEKLSGTKFDISNYADITEAIHVVQTQMGITGTTAKEASATISGSISSTQAAIGNLIAGLGNADADIRMLVNNVVDSFGNVIDNIIPVLENLVGALPEVFETIIPALGDMLPKLLDVANMLFGEVLNALIQLTPELIPFVLGALGTIGQTLLDNFPMLIDTAAQIIVSLATGIAEALPDLIPTVVETVIIIVSTLIDNLPLLLDAGMQLLWGLTEGIIEAIPLLVEQLPELILQIINFLSDNLPIILEQGSQMILSLANGILEALPQLIEQLPAIITGIVSFITENLPLIVETGINLLVQLGIGIIQAIPELVAQLPQVITAIIDGFAQLPGMMIEIGGNIVKGLWEGIKNLAGWIWDKVSGWAGDLWDGICGFFGIHSPSRKFAWAGEMMVEGLAGSIDENGDDAVKAVKTMADDIEGVMPTDIDGPDINFPKNPNGAMPYRVSPIIEGATAPGVDDVYYGVKPVVNEFSPPDVTADRVHGDGAVTSERTESATFAPIITVQVQSNANEEDVENMKKSLREVVKELYEEFRDDERERLALKSQYA